MPRHSTPKIKYKAKILNQDNLPEIQKQRISPANKFPENNANIYTYSILNFTPF